MRASAAYDLSQFAPERETNAEPKVRVVRQPHEIIFQKKILRLKIRCALLTALLMAMMFVTVNSRTKLNETTSAIQSRGNDLVALESESTYLNYELENMVSLKNAEEYAQNELGLIKVSSSQIEYVNLQSENVIEADAKVGGFLPFAKYLIKAVMEMFS